MATLTKNLFDLSDEELANPDTYSRTETRGGYRYDIDGLGGIISAAAQAITPPGESLSETKERIRQGLEPDAVRAEIEKLRLQAERKRRREDRINANLGEHHGYIITREERLGPEGGHHDEYVIVGPYCEALTLALKAEKARFDRERKAWRLPVSKHARLKKIIEQLPTWLKLQQDAQVGRAEEARSLCGTYGPVTIRIADHVLRFEYEFDREINEIVKRHEGRFSRRHGAWYLKLDQVEEARAIIQDLQALMLRRAEDKRLREDEIKQAAVVEAAKKQITRDHAASMLDAVTGRSDGAFYSGLHSVQTTESGFRIAFPYDPVANERMRSLGGRFKSGSWHVPLSAAEGVIRFIQDVLTGNFPSSDAPETRQCWECGRYVTRAEVIRNGGTWNEGNPFEPGTCYCGC